MAFHLTRQAGTLLRAFELRDAHAGAMRKAELRDHGTSGPVIWLDNGTTSWGIFLGGPETERYRTPGGAK